MLKRAKITSLAVGIGILSILALATPAGATESSGIGAKPANPRDDNPRTSSIFVHEINPGGQVNDALTVSNNSDTTKKILVYPTDTQVASGGTFACEQKADEKNQEGSWIKLDKEELTLQRNSSETIGFTIEVPNNASVGEHNACIAIQAVEAPQSSQVNGVNLSFRSAIRVAVTVPGEFKKQLTFESLDVKSKDSKKLISKQVLRNSGNVSLDTNLITKVKTIFGISVSQSGGQYPILPGQSSEFNFELNKPIWGGFYIIDASGTYDSDPSSSLGEKSNSKQTVSKSKIILLAPSPIISLVYIIILLLATSLIYKVRKDKSRKAELTKKSISHTVKNGENIMTIGAKYDADWKKTAKLNSLKSPYTLENGQELLVVPGPNYKEIKTSSKKTKRLKEKTPKTPKKETKTKSTSTKKTPKKSEKNKE